MIKGLGIIKIEEPDIKRILKAHISSLGVRDPTKLLKLVPTSPLSVKKS